MERFFQNIVSGISMGSIYALVALGFNIIYNSTGIINFAQGEFVMLGGMFMVLFAATVGLPLPVAFAATVVLVVCVGFAMERCCIRPLKKPSILTLIMITIAVSIIIKGVTMHVAGKETHSIEYFSGYNTSIKVAGVIIPTQTLWVLGTLGVVVGALIVFFNFTLAGKAMRACAVERTAASLMGIPTSRYVMFSFVLSAAIGAMAGAVVMPLTQVEYQSGAMFGIKGFGAAVLGGLGNNAGAVVAGLLIGILEAETAGYISSHYKDALPLVVLLLVLFIRPSGLFGSRAAGKLTKY